jgi:TNF receptor-associated protein 1
LSRELLQNSAQIRKLRTVITNKFLRFLQERARKETKSFLEFYKDYGFFFKEGIITSSEQVEKEEISKLLRFEVSTRPAGELISLPEYCESMRAGQRDIYYLSAPSRQLAENSPYFEALKRKDVDVLFCYEAYDELVLMQLQQFDKKKLTSVEKEMRQDAEPQAEEDDKNALPGSEQDDLINWLQGQLGSKAAKVKITRRLESHPCVITVEEMAAARLDKAKNTLSE